MTTAPDLYGITDAELADELRNINASHAVELQGPVTITAGVRRCPLGGPDHPVILARGAEGLHLLALPGDGAA
jgi:hypothetical protein